MSSAASISTSIAPFQPENVPCGFFQPLTCIISRTFVKVPQNQWFSKVKLFPLCIRSLHGAEVLTAFTEGPQKHLVVLDLRKSSFWRLLKEHRRL